MSGTRHGDTHVEYILDTETWLGPYEETPYERVEEVAGLIESAGPEGEGAARPAPGPVVEAHLQRDRERGRGADRPAARRATSPPRTSPADLGHLVHELVDEGKARRRGGGDRAARGPVGDERPRDAPWQRALPIDARGRRGAPPDRDRPDHRLARRARRSVIGVPVPLHTRSVPPRQGEGGFMVRERGHRLQRSRGGGTRRKDASGPSSAALVLALAAAAARRGEHRRRRRRGASRS